MAIINIKIMTLFLFIYFFSPQLQLIVLGRCPDSNASGWGWRAGGGGDRDGVSGGGPEWWTVRASRETMVCMVHLYRFDLYLRGLTVLFLFLRMKEVTVTDKKVLLVCTGGQYSAVGGQCSHYSAPLVKGAPSTTLRPFVFVYRKEKCKEKKNTLLFIYIIYGLWLIQVYWLARECGVPFTALASMSELETLKIIQVWIACPPIRYHIHEYAVVVNCCV